MPSVAVRCMPRLSARDLDHVLEHASPAWDEPRGARILMTGGTGFFGRWLVESLLHADDRLGLGTSLVLLSRDPAAFGRRAPHLVASSRVTLIEGDVRTFVPTLNAYTHLVHGAHDTTGTLNVERPIEMFDTIAAGTRHVLDVAARASVGRVLLLSSGAVYGRQPSALTHIPESYLGAPDQLDLSQAYAEGKRVAELLGAAAVVHAGLDVVIALCFAFVGSHLHLDAHFAAGTFVLEALHDEVIRVAGDRSAYRSYLHAADLAVLLWTLIVR